MNFARKYLQTANLFRAASLCLLMTFLYSCRANESIDYSDIRKSGTKTDNLQGSENSKKHNSNKMTVLSNGSVPSVHPNMKMSEKKLAEDLTDEDQMASSDEERRSLGTELYAMHCAACHGELIASDKLNASAEDISRSIGSDAPGLEQMNAPSLIDLKSDGISIELIALALKEPSRIIQIPLGTRQFVASKFRYLYTDASTDEPINNQINTIINEKIQTQVAVFGGACRRRDNDPVCNAVDLMTLRAEAQPLPSTLRYGYISTACDEIHSIEGNAAINSVLAKIPDLDASSPITPENVVKIFEIYARGQEADPNVMNILAEIGSWNLISATICQSPYMDML